MGEERGNAAIEGYRFEAALVAFVGIHILAKEPLRWLEGGTSDVPLAISLASGDASADFQVQLAGTSTVLMIEAKRGLYADKRFDNLIEKFASGLEYDSTRHYILITDSTASRSIRDNLRSDLSKLRLGYSSTLSSITQRVMKHFAGNSTIDPHDFATRISVHVLDIEEANSPAKLLALFLLRRILDDPKNAELAWEVLISNGFQFIEAVERFDYSNLRALLENRDIHLTEKKFTSISENTISFSTQQREATTSKTFEVFFSYAREDKQYRDRLAASLEPLKRQGLIDWHDRTNDFENQHLYLADILLLLVSPSYMTSDSCYLEMMRAMERYERGEARIIPIILRSTVWGNAPFSKLIALPLDGNPVANWQRSDEAFANIVTGLQKVIGELTENVVLDTSSVQTSLEPAKTIHIFYSYASQDRELRAEFAAYLQPLKSRYRVTEWYFDDISAGTDWAREVDTHLSTADIILLLVSPDFIASDYCYSIEMQRAMERHARGEVYVIPILLQPVDIEGMPFNNLQYLPYNGKPVSLWDNRHEVFTDLARDIEQIIADFNTRLAPGLLAARNAIPTIPKMTKPIDIFYCYAHEDTSMCDELDRHLVSLKRSGQIITWRDIDIAAGASWERELHRHLITADIILLLVSPDFVASDYCYSVEMRRAMERHVRGEARVIPILLQPVDYEGAPFNHLQHLPYGGKPVSLWDNRNEVFTDIAKAIRKIIEDLKNNPAVY